mgnify:CR=1 FL=1
MLSVVSNIRLGLEKYYNEALQAQNYDFQTNKFKQSFVDSQTKRYSNSMESAPWVYGSITYLDVLNTLTMDAYASTMQEYIKALHAMAAPSTGTPEGINSLINLVNSLERNLRSTIGVKRDPSNAQHGVNTPKRIVNIKHEIKSIFDSNVAKNAGIDYLSGQVTNFDGLRVVTGAEWESRTTSETNKFFTGTTDMTLNIVGEESSSPTFSTDIMQMAYLSPASIDLYNNSYDLLNGASNFDPSYCDEIVYTALSYSPATPPPFSPDTLTTAALLSTTSNSGLTLMTEAEFRIALPNPDALNLAQDYVGENSKFLTEDLDQEVFPEPVTPKLTSNSYKLLTALCGPSIFSNAASPSQPGSAFDAPITSIPTLSKFNLASTSNPITDKLTSLTLKGHSKETALGIITEELKTIPNQLKSIMVTAGTPTIEGAPTESSETQLSSIDLPSEISSGPVVATEGAGAESVKANWFSTGIDSFTTETTISTMVLNYQMLSQIEVLTGYEGMSNGSPSVKAPIWKPMTQELYDANFNKLLLCKIVRYSDTTLGISTPSGVELPIYNEYFFLKPFDVSAVDVIVESTTYPTPSQAQLKTSILPNLTVEVESLMSTLGYTTSQQDVASIETEYLSTINIPYAASQTTTQATNTQTQTTNTQTTNTQTQTMVTQTQNGGY